MSGASTDVVFPKDTIIGLPGKEVLMTPNIHTIIRQHVSLEVRCIDRVYLHAYMPKLQTSGGLCYFLHDHLGYPVPSPALLKALKGRLVDRIKAPANAIARLVDDHLVDGLTDAHAAMVLEALDKLKAVDPACGSGAYLLGLLQEMIAIRRALQSEKLVVDRQFLYKLKLHIISNNLYGVDIDPFATEIAKLRLWLSLAVEADKPIPLPNLDFKIETGDSLLGPNPQELPDLFRLQIQKQADLLVDLKGKHLTARGGAKKKIRDAILAEEAAIGGSLHAHLGPGVVDWRIQFADVFVSNGGFDVVLANPPYVNMVQMDAADPAYRATLKANFTATKGGFDLFVPFMERGVELTTRNGMFVYIVPNKLLSAEYATELRRYFARHTTLLSITDLSRVPVFSAAVYPVIVVAQNRVCDSAVDIVTGYRANAKSQDDISLVEITKTSMAATVRAGGRWSPLIDSVEGRDVGGIVAKCKTLGDLANVSGAATVSEAYEWKKAVIDNGGKLLKTNPKRYAPFIVSGNVRRHFHTWSADNVQDIKHSYCQPVLDKQNRVVAARRVRQVESFKLIVSGMSKRPTCVWDRGGIAAGKSTVIAIPKLESDGPYLAAILNSQAMSRIYTSLFGSLSLSGGYLRFGPPQLKVLPIPEASDGEKKSLAALAKKCAMRGSDGAEDVEKEIDERVAKLFGM